MQADDGVLDPHRLARLQGDIADDPVALVEEAEDGDPLRHRGHPRHRARAARNGGGRRLLRRLTRLLDPVASAGAKHRHRAQSQYCPHAQSGIHGW
ncbi:MAG: hypothetical protein ABIT68_10640 [Sphingomicrobium sp.]